MLSSNLKTIRCKVMAFGGSKPMHVVGKLGVEIGNNSLKSPFFASCGIYTSHGDNLRFLVQPP
jgi:hypothetical protein